MRNFANGGMKGEDAEGLKRFHTTSRSLTVVAKFCKNARKIILGADCVLPCVVGSEGPEPLLGSQGKRCKRSKSEDATHSSVPGSHNCMAASFSGSRNILMCSRILSPNCRNFTFVTRRNTHSTNKWCACYQMLGTLVTRIYDRIGVLRYSTLQYSTVER